MIVIPVTITTGLVHSVRPAVQDITVLVIWEEYVYLVTVFVKNVLVIPSVHSAPVEVILSYLVGIVSVIRMQECTLIIRPILALVVLLLLLTVSLATQLDSIVPVFSVRQVSSSTQRL